jgi:DNA-binding MarR family transcriptional regulator
MVDTIDLIKAIDPSMTMEAWQALLLIAVQDVKSVNELKQRLDVSMSTASRIVAYLSDAGSRGKTGLGIVEVGHNPQDRRRLVISLSNSGEELVRAVIAGIEQGVALLNHPKDNGGPLLT